MVITYGVEAFQSLQGKQNITTILSGGERDSRTGSLVGLVAQQTVSGFSMDCCILSASAIDPESGTTEPTMEEVEMKQSMAKSSQRVIMAVDATKLSHRSSVRSFDLARSIYSSQNTIPASPAWILIGTSWTSDDTFPAQPHRCANVPARITIPSGVAECMI